MARTIFSNRVDCCSVPPGPNSDLVIFGSTEIAVAIPMDARCSRDCRMFYDRTRHPAEFDHDGEFDGENAV
ncbi:hypothetical protein PM082_021739 [Marasmius tenuissimus]|nr:hypothetical protein PM082_021739 [Marasmius tenuissimus]